MQKGGGNVISRVKKPRVLIVTPEVTRLPKRMGNLANVLEARAGGLADVSSALITSLFNLGADVHVAVPHYRALFNLQRSVPNPLTKEEETIKKNIPKERVHTAQDRAFFYLEKVYSRYGWTNMRTSLAFQREVINNIMREVKPDIVHCNDWTTGLIPAVARHLGIPSLFTVHNIHTVKTTMAHIEDMGIDTAAFWKNLYFERIPNSYEEARENDPVDFLTSGIFAAHFVNTVSPSFLREIVEGKHDFVEPQIRSELTNKWEADCAFGILNAPDPSYHPKRDKDLYFQFGAESFVSAKRKSKSSLQKHLGLKQNDKAPLFFWPSRLDTVQKGCQLLAEILYQVVSRYWDQTLQIVFVANGEFQRHFKDIVSFHNLHKRVAVCDFDESLARKAYGASDFILMPSRFEPCGLPQMIGPIYGALPVAHDTGGIHDTITHLNVEKDSGNGFLFKNFDSADLSWAIDQAMMFYNLPGHVKNRQIRRIMRESIASFNHKNTARQYIDLYEKMLQRPLIH